MLGLVALDGRRGGWALMQYMGGKSRIAKQLARVIREHTPNAHDYWDAFCGGLSASVALSEYGRVHASDINPALVSLYRAVRRGWEPPMEVSEHTWRRAKNLPDSDPLKAFCGFCCSYGGRYFEGYARDPNGTRNRNGVPSNYAAGAALKLPTEARVPWEVGTLDFTAIRPVPIRWVIYCDPPYLGAKGYSSCAPFDRALFTTRVREWSEHTDVFVSEYSFPIGEVVWQGRQTTTLSKTHLRPVERLYHVARGSL